MIKKRVVILSLKLKHRKMKYSINETKQVIKFYSKNKVFEKK